MERNIFNLFKQQIFIWVCCFCFVANAQQKDLTSNAEVSVLTCGTGDDLYALFGHTALRFKDKSQGIDLVFNYGMFDFDTDNFYLKFIKGDLQYYLAIDQYAEFVNYYSYKDRSITEQKLNLTFEEKKDIWLTVWSQYQSDEKFYHYKFIENNCTTKVVDLLNDYSSYKIETNFESNNKTYREILNSYLQLQYLPQLGINMVFGKKVDKQNALLFLPEQFLAGIEKTNKLQLEKKEVYKTRADRNNAFQISKWVFFVVVLLLSVFSKNLTLRRIYFTIVGVLGLLILFLQLYSQHMELLSNPFVGVYNPLYLLFLFSFRKKKFVLNSLTAVSIASLFLLSFESFVILLPLILLHFIFIYQELTSYLKKK